MLLAVGAMNFLTLQRTRAENENNSTGYAGVQSSWRSLPERIEKKIRLPCGPGRNQSEKSFVIF
jgi:hypothetical protein